MAKSFVVYLPNNNSYKKIKYDNIKVHIKISTTKIVCFNYILLHFYWVIALYMVYINSVVHNKCYYNLCSHHYFIVYLKASCSFSLLLCWCRFNCFLSKQLQLLFSCFAAVATNTTGIAATFIIIHK